MFYNLDTHSEEILGNEDFVNSCMDSVRAEDPIQLRIMYERRGHHYDTPTDEYYISCLDYLLDASISQGKIQPSDKMLLDELASMDLHNEFCTFSRRDSDNNLVIKSTSCLPKIIEVYSKTQTRGFPNTRVSLENSMSEIMSKNIDLVMDNCEVGTSQTCFTRLLNVEGSYKFFNGDTLPEGFFNSTMCKSYGDTVLCFRTLVDNVLGGNGSIPQINSKYILSDIIKSKKYESSLYEDQSTCAKTSQSSAQRSSRIEGTCFDKIMDGYVSYDQVDLMNVINETYDGGNDETGGSPFNGEKCNAPEPIHCLDQEISTIGFVIASDPTYVEKLDGIMKNPRYSGVCGSMELLSLLSTGYNLSGYGGNSHKVRDYIEKTLPYIDIDGVSMPNPLISPSPDINRGKTKLAMLNTVSETMKCMSKTNGSRISPFEYALQNGAITFSMVALKNKNFIMPYLFDSSCKSTSGDTINCIDKVVSDLISSQTTLERGLDMISEVLQEAEIDKTYLPMLYPDTKPYFITTAIDSLYNIASEVTENERVIKKIDIVIERILDSVDKYTRGNNVDIPKGKQIDLSKLVELMEHFKPKLAAPRLKGGEPGWTERKRKLDRLTDTLLKQSVYTPSDLSNLTETTLFKDTHFHVQIELLAKWRNLYKDDSLLQSKITSVIDRLHGDLYNGVESLPENDELLFNFFKLYMKLVHDFNRDSGKGHLVKFEISPAVRELFKELYQTTMEEYFAPSPETRKLYDTMCFKFKGYRNKRAERHGFVDQVVGNSTRLENGSRLKHDHLGITGVYNVTVGGGFGWGKTHIMRYLDAMNLLLWGSGDSSKTIGKPYITWEKNQHSVPIGLIDAVSSVSPTEKMGKADGVMGSLRLLRPSFPSPDNFGKYSYDTDAFVHKFKNMGGDIKLTLAYVDTDGKFIPKYDPLEFNMMDIMQKLPRKLKRELQAKYPILFGQIESVVSYEKTPVNEDTTPKNYKLVISNKPIDILRIGTCQQFDDVTCMSLFGGCYNETMVYYIDDGSYVAYLTKNNEYEPQWMARLLMHQVTDCDKCLSVQTNHELYDINDSDNQYPNFKIVLDAVNVVLADNGINRSAGRDQHCTFHWDENSEEQSRGYIEQHGHDACNEEMDRRSDDCAETCETECEEKDYDDEVYGVIDEEIADQITSELSDHLDENGDSTLSDDEIEDLREHVREEVVENRYGEVRDGLETDCKDECDCDNINDDFDCYEYLLDNDYLNNDNDGDNIYVDERYIHKLVKGDEKYKNILLERTGQAEDSSKFVQLIKSKF